MILSHSSYKMKSASTLQVSNSINNITCEGKKIEINSYPVIIIEINRD
jgi:hypothetical protein